MILNISTIESYDIATALRGPDSSKNIADTVKVLTTAVLRYCCGCKWGIVQSPIKAQDSWADKPLTVRREVKQFWYSEDHFRQHLYYAAEHVPAFKQYFIWFNNELNQLKG